MTTEEKRRQFIADLEAKRGMRRSQYRAPFRVENAFGMVACFDTLEEAQEAAELFEGTITEVKPPAGLGFTKQSEK
jgi:hypothetical protein